jgi:hypothetical protein
MEYSEVTDLLQAMSQLPSMRILNAEGKAVIITSVATSREAAQQHYDSVKHDLIRLIDAIDENIPVDVIYTALVDTAGTFAKVLSDGNEMVQKMTKAIEHAEALRTN